MLGSNAKELAMNPRYRSFSGALIAIFAVPVFLGLTACLPTFPVPVGNPEKSRIDPYRQVRQQHGRVLVLRFQAQPNSRDLPLMQQSREA